MFAVFFTVALSGPLPPKEMGVILGVAVLLDAALVRLLLVPVLLRLLGRWAWYLPRPLGRLIPQVRFGERAGPASSRGGTRRVGLRLRGGERERHRLAVTAGAQRVARADVLAERDRHGVIGHRGRVGEQGQRDAAHVGQCRRAGARGAARPRLQR